MAICVIHCRPEFQRKHFGFGDVHPGRFSLFQWRSPAWLYLIYRIVLAVYVDTWLIVTTIYQVDFTGSVWENGTADKNGTTSKNGTVDIELYAWPVYLTNWTYLMLALYLTFHAVGMIIFISRGPLSLRHTPSKETHRTMFSEVPALPSLDWEGNQYSLGDEEDEVSVRVHQLPWYFKVTWILYNMISSSAVMVTAVFFIFLWPQFGASGIGMLNFQLHAVNSIIIIIEHLISAVPIRLLHIIYPLIYGLLYVLFSVVFWAVDHSHVIYPMVLDWNQPGPTFLMILVLAVVVFPILQLIFFLIYKAKIRIYKSIS